MARAGTVRVRAVGRADRALAFVGGVIIGVQWVVVSETGPAAVWAGRAWGCRRSWLGRRWPGCSPSSRVRRRIGAARRRSSAGGVVADDAQIRTRPAAVADGARPSSADAPTDNGGHHGGTAPRRRDERSAGAAVGAAPVDVPARHRSAGVARPPGGGGSWSTRWPWSGGPPRHERTQDAARWLVRNAVLYIATGALVLGRRWWEARTNARYERLMRAAEAAGDYERLTDWEQRARAGPGTAAPPPDGLDHRPAGPGPRRRRR